MHYVSVEGLSKSFGIKPLFRNISFHIEEGDKIALVARNGSGKSTLLKILSGKETADEGRVWVHKDVSIALFEQDPVFKEDKSILDNIFDHNHPVINAIREYELAMEENDSDKLTEAIIAMDERGAWDFDTKVQQILGKLNVHHLNQAAGTLSGGQRKRVALAKTLIDIGFEHKHILLIMDEPTNHLDVEMVEWLEHYLNQEKVTLLMVTHDRYFLDSVCEEIWEMDGESLFVYRGDYENFMEKKAARIDSELASIDKAKNLYRKELEWMRKQPKARTTKSKSRQDNFYQVENKAKQRITDDRVQLQVKMTRLGGKIAELKRVAKSFGEKTILKGFDYTFKRGERIGIIGKNGTGKSTFLQILQQIIPPDSGKVVVGDTIVFGNFSQQGLEIKEDKRVIEFVKDIAEYFPLADGSTLNAGKFLEMFLFTPDQQYTYISKLSGGEKRRLHLLSVLFKNPNFLILDEPTNDLDLQTLGVLENFLSEYQGCLIIVSHDRYFMDRLVDHLLVFEGEGNIKDFPGNYSQYRMSAKDEERTAGQENRTSPASGEKKAPAEAPAPAPASLAVPGSEARKLSYKEKREFETLEKEIAALEQEKAELHAKLQDSNVHFNTLQELSLRIGEIEALLNEKEMRWLELSE